MPIEKKNRIVCTGCSLLCDDISIDLQFNTIQVVHNACLRGTKKFQFSASKERLKTPGIKASVNGGRVDASLDEAMDAAAALLKNASNIVITGISHMSCAAQSLALQLALKLHAAVAIQDLDVFNQLTRVIQKQGLEFFTLGEAMNNADLLVFWGANVIDLSPKFLAKTVFSRGRYRQSGKEVKKMAVIDDYPTPTMERADIKIAVDDCDHDTILTRLIDALVTNKVIDASLLASDDGITANVSSNVASLVKDLADAMTNAEYCTIMLGEAILNPQFLHDNPGFLEKFFRFIKSMNGTKKKVALLPMVYTWNYGGLLQELGMATGDVDAIDFRDLPSKVTAGTVILALGSDFISKLPRDALASVHDVQTICLDFKRTLTTDHAAVLFPVTMTGIDDGGFATRLDGISLNLNPPVAKKENAKSDAEVLQYLLNKLQE
jgi:formylmethanofuran dehydrogenase subunit B